MQLLINNAIDALILFIRIIRAYWNCIYLWWEELQYDGKRSGSVSKRRNFIWSQKIHMKKLFRTFWNLTYFLKGFRRALIQKNWEATEKKRFQGETWENTVWGVGSRGLWKTRGTAYESGIRYRLYETIPYCKSLCVPVRFFANKLSEVWADSMKFKLEVGRGKYWMWLRKEPSTNGN